MYTLLWLSAIPGQVCLQKKKEGNAPESMHADIIASTRAWTCERRSSAPDSASQSEAR